MCLHCTDSIHTKIAQFHTAVSFWGCQQQQTVMSMQMIKGRRCCTMISRYQTVYNHFKYENILYAVHVTVRRSCESSIVGTFSYFYCLNRKKCARYALYSMQKCKRKDCWNYCECVMIAAFHWFFHKKNIYCLFLRKKYAAGIWDWERSSIQAFALFISHSHLTYAKMLRIFI